MNEEYFELAMKAERYLTLRRFVEESNRIEGIYVVRDHEVAALEALLVLPAVTSKDLQKFVLAVQPQVWSGVEQLKNGLRRKAGMNV